MSHVLTAPAVAADPAVIESMLATLCTAGARGATAAELRLEKRLGARANMPHRAGLPPRRAALLSLIATGRVQLRRGRHVLTEFAASVDTVTAKVLDAAEKNTGETPALWRKSELAQMLSAAERPLLDAVLAQLREKREVLCVPDGLRGGGRFFFAKALRRWLGVAADQSPGLLNGARNGTSEASALLAAYRRAVRASGGFPDVKISALRRGLPAPDAAALNETLRTLWLAGEVTLSLGDWSLASEEMRESAVELDGERYLLVRFEEDAPDEPITGATA